MNPRFALFFLAMACLGCTAPLTPRFATKGEDLIGVEGLQRLENVRFQRVWGRQGVSFDGYSALSPIASGIYYRQDSPGAPNLPRYASHRMSQMLNDFLMAELREIFGKELKNADDWRIVHEAGPGVLVVRIRLADMVLNTPLRHLGGDDLVWVNSIGAFTLGVDLVDSETNELVARVRERRNLQTLSGRPIRAVSANAVYESRRIFHDWADKLTSLLGGLRLGLADAQADAAGARRPAPSTPR